MFGELTIPQIDHLVSHQLIGRIGCHADGITYVVPVSYTYEDGYVYVYTYSGKKIDMMRKNPNVCFQVDDTTNMAYWKSAICWGEFEELTEAAAKKAALDKLQSRVLPVLNSETMHLSKDWPFPARPNEKLPGIFFRIKITKKAGRFESMTGHDFFAT